MITCGFGMTTDLDRGTMRQWVMGHDGVKRWADTNDPVENLPELPTCTKSQTGDMRRCKPWAAECIDRKYGTEECEGCHDRDEEIDRLKDALRMAADEPNIDKARKIADAVLMPNAEVTGASRNGEASG